MENSPKNLNYILGLDLGISSVGWAIVEIDEDENPVNLIDLGVRTFETAEVPKTGESLALARRLARSARRLIKRRAMRMKKARRLLKAENLILDFNEKLPINPWELRVEGLDRKLERQEWASVLLHFVKHRGYKSQRKNEDSGDNKELGKLLGGINNNQKLIQAGEYRTPAEIAIKKFCKEEGHIRNQRGSYTHSFGRNELVAELELLFEKQRAFGNSFASKEFYAKFYEILMWQKPPLEGDAILKMLGKCTLEKEEYRCAKNTFSAERFVWLTKLNNLRILESGTERALSMDERRTLLEIPYEKSKLTYHQVRILLNLSDQAIFKGVRYGREEDKKAVENKTTLMELKAYQAIKKTLKDSCLSSEWEGLKTKSELLDDIGTAFSLYKTDQDITQYLNGKLSEDVLNALLSSKHIKFDKFINLSLTALRKLIPLMEEGWRYDEACKEVYGNHYGKNEKENNRLLPQIPTEEIRNPVVLRSLTQARKVINAVVREYGSPAYIHIETARELGKSYSDRKKIERNQEDNRKEKEREIENFKESFPDFGEPKSKDILKLRLYKHQHGKCLYSGKTLDISRLMEKGYVEIDHALPFSRTWDNSFNNKVLVLTNENQNKGNLTPYEWLDGKNNSERWRNFKARVETSMFPYNKKQSILTSKLDEKDFIQRNLNDTRYIARFLTNFVSEKMHLTGKNKLKVFASNGQITALLRGRWGLAKVRTDNDRHHALDAVVVACSTRSIQQRITRFMRYEEGKLVKDSNNLTNAERIDSETGEIISLHFPTPWNFFREEVNIRVFSDNPKLELDNLLKDRPQANHEYVRPLFVSRMPTRKMTGQGHMETIKSAKRFENEKVSVIKKTLTSIKLSDLEKMVNRKREPKLYAGLKERLEQFNNDPMEAFKNGFEKDGGAIVKAIRIEDIQKSGVTVNSGLGVADNASMVRVDVFLKNNKYFLVPIYTWQVAKGILPNKGVIQGKDEIDWEEMDETATFLFSLTQNDLIKLTIKNKITFGYFNGLDRANGRIAIKEHDKGKNGIHRVGTKTAQSFKKYCVDVLGKKITQCQNETRQPVGFKRNKK